MRASGYARADDEWYVEPRWAVDALLDAERPFSGKVWDPCCGGGNIPDALRARGYHPTATDLVDRGYQHGLSGVDFFASAACATSIISNPPYDRAQAFIDRALTLTTDRVCVLLRLAFLEGQARKAWFPQVPLARVWVSSRRISMPPGGLGVTASGGTVAYGWFVFDHAHVGDPVLGWV